MWSSAIRESVLVVAAATAGIAVVTAWSHERPSRCTHPSAASVEMLFAPCLVAAQTAAPNDNTLEPMPPFTIPPTTAPTDGPAVARRGQGDVETTGSIRPK